jgi:hypothetical protein
VISHPVGDVKSFEESERVQAEQQVYWLQLLDGPIFKVVSVTHANQEKG